MYHSFNLDILNKISLKNFKDKKNHVIFCGSSQTPGTTNHLERYSLLYSLLDQNSDHIDIYLNEIPNLKDNFVFNAYQLKKILGNKFLLVLSNAFKLFSIFNKLIFIKYFKKLFNMSFEIKEINENKKVFRGPLKKIFKKKIMNSIWGNKSYEVINNYKLSLNIHADFSKNEIGNIRIFENAGLKTAGIVNYGNNINDLFREDHSIVTYKNYNELSEKIKFLKNNPKFSENLANEAFKTLINYHTDKHRFE